MSGSVDKPGWPSHFALSKRIEAQRGVIGRLQRENHALSAEVDHAHGLILNLLFAVESGKPSVHGRTIAEAKRFVGFDEEAEQEEA